MTVEEKIGSVDPPEDDGGPSLIVQLDDLDGDETPLITIYATFVGGAAHITIAAEQSASLRRLLELAEQRAVVIQRQKRRAEDEQIDRAPTRENHGFALIKGGPRDDKRRP